MSFTLPARPLVAAILFSCGALAFAAEPAPPKPAPTLQERAEVALHLIDVVVTDPAGRPIPGLTPQDFDVKIDGEARPVRYVDAPLLEPLPVAAAAPAAAPTAPSAPPRPTATAPRWVTMVFHADGISPLYRKQAIDAARRLAREALTPRDRLAIATLKEGALEYMQPFTPATEVSANGFPTIEALLGTADPLASRIRQLVESFRNCRQTSATTGTCYENVSAEFVQNSRAATANSIHALQGLVAALAPLPGRKAVLFFTDGLTMRPGQVVIDSFERYDPAMGTFYSRLQDPPNWDFQDLVTDGAKNRVSFFCVKTGQSLDLENHDASQSPQSEELQKSLNNAFVAFERETGSALREIANATGGRLLISPTSRDITPQFFDQMKGTYTLGVSAEGGDSIRSTVKVKLAKVKGTVRFPEHLVRRGTQRNDLAGRLHVDAQAEGGVPVRLVLDLSTMAVGPGDDDRAVSRIAVYYVVLDAAGNTVQDDYQVQVIPRAGGSSDFLFPLNLKLAPGTYTIRLAASDLIGRGQFNATESITAK